MFPALLLCLALLLTGCGGAEKPAPTPEPAPEEEETLTVVSDPGGGVRVARKTGEAWFPQEKDWTYHFSYAYPVLLGEDYASAAINDTYQMALDEMLQLMLPMFSQEENMLFDGKNEVRHDFAVTYHSRQLLSVVQYRSQTQGAEGTVLSMEPLTFDLVGAFQGQPLTLRGVILALIADVPANDMTAEAYPQAAALIEGSSDTIAEAVAGEIWPAFRALQQSGEGRADVTEEDFLWECSPASNFFVDSEGRLVFFLPPSLLNAPSFDTPQYLYTPAELEALMEKQAGSAEQAGAEG